jgi:hypothetical protein
MRAEKPRNAAPPPPALDGFRVLEYAFIERPVCFSGRTHFFVDGKEMGRLSRLAIGEQIDGTGIAILHATPSWRVLGAQGGYTAVEPARQRAERMYPGVSDHWVKANVTKRQARAYEGERWQPYACNFCGKIPPELTLPMAASSRTGAVICLASVHRTRPARPSSQLGRVARRGRRR